MKAEEFDQKFDDGVEDINGDLDLLTVRRVNQETKNTAIAPQAVGTNQLNIEKDNK
ncbi:MAG: hypothetical protein P1U57_10330 [Oleibacter sp.]|nr:hypothetical protein [Thalassolituus sp.]